MPEFNPTMALMQLFKMPMTRDSYLNLNHAGAPPSEVHPEEEAEMPKRFRHPIIHSNTMPEPYMTEAQKKAEKAQGMTENQKGMQQITIGGDQGQGARKIPYHPAEVPSVDADWKDTTPVLDTDNPPQANRYMSADSGIYKGEQVMNNSNPAPQDWGAKQPREQ